MDGRFRIWDTTNGQMLSTTAMPAQAVGRFAGRSFVAMWKDRAPELWDAATGQFRCKLDAPPDPYVSARADSRQVVAAWGARELRVLDAESGALVRPAIQLDRPCYFAALSPDGLRVAAAFSGFTYSIFDAKTGARTAGPLRHLGSVRPATFTADGRILATGSDDKMLRLWDAATGEPIGAPMPHSGYVVPVSAQADGRAFATAGSDGVARLWEFPPAPESVEEMARVAHRLNGRAE